MNKLSQKHSVRDLAKSLHEAGVSGNVRMFSEPVGEKKLYLTLENIEDTFDIPYNNARFNDIDDEYLRSHCAIVNMTNVIEGIWRSANGSKRPFSEDGWTSVLKEFADDGSTTLVSNYTIEL